VGISGALGCPHKAFRMGSIRGIKHLLAHSGDRRPLTTMVHVWCQKANPTMAMPRVVPRHKPLHPRFGLVQTVGLIFAILALFSLFQLTLAQNDVAENINILLR
jgi:hypothetical protein